MTATALGTGPGHSTRMAALAGHFGSDIERALQKLEPLLGNSLRGGIDLLVLPNACLGGYISDLEAPDEGDLPEAIALDGPEIAELCRAAGPMTVCLGVTESTGGVRYNTAVCLSGDGVLGTHRKVHQPVNEGRAYAAGDAFAAFDSPVGRIGMLTDYDKTFPEAARSLALQGADILAVLNAWPASTTDRSDRILHDRQSHLFNLYDEARAAENQVFIASSNQTGIQGGLRFLGQAKIVGPGGNDLAHTGVKGGLAIADADVAGDIARARRTLHHLRERRPEAYAAGHLCDPCPSTSAGPSTDVEEKTA